MVFSSHNALAVPLGLLLAAATAVGVVSASTVQPLESWAIQNCATANASHWYPLSKPMTVLAGLVENGVYSDLFYGENLAAVDTAQFLGPWYYRTTFALPPTPAPTNGTRYVLSFKGLNYRANVWVNDVAVGTSDVVVGTFRYFEFDVTAALAAAPSPSASHTVLVQVYPPVNSPWVDNTTDLAITFVDWAPFPPDNNLGLWREVELLTLASGVRVAYPLVTTLPTTNAWSTASLDVLVELTNYDAAASAPVTLSAVIRDPAGAVVAQVLQSLTLAPGEVRQAVFAAAEYPALTVANPLLWWPWQMGAPNMYTLSVRVSAGAVVSDALTTSFGIRVMSDEIDANGNRRYSVNGKPILLRGAGYCPELLLRSETDPVTFRQWMDYARHIGLNVLRFEGKHPGDALYDMADAYGMLMVPGWCCCDSWQHWTYWTEEQHFVAAESTRSQVKRLRIHPSVLSFWYSSDELPPADVEREFLAVFSGEQWPNTLLASASALNSNVSGPTGVKMSGPYSWTPPVYFETDTQHVAGGAWGLLTEGGPGEAPMPLESQLITMPTGDLWPIGSDWDYHCGGQRGFFGNLKRYVPPLAARYGPSQTVSDFTRKSQADTYAGLQAMYEGYARNKYQSTGVIQWMLNNAFPQNIWHLWDFYLNPAGGYFGARKACAEALHIQYDYDSAGVSVVNSLYTPSVALHAFAALYDLSGAVLHTADAPVSALAGDGVARGVIAALPVPNVPHFVRLWLTTAAPAPASPFDFGADSDDATRDAGYAPHRALEAAPPLFASLPLGLFKRADDAAADGRAATVVSTNTYWLSAAQSGDVLVWDNSTWYNTPCSQYADLTALQDLPPVSIDAVPTTIVQYANFVTTVQLTSPATSIAVAFLVRLRLRNAVTQADVAPIFWSDNYVTLMPGDVATVVASYAQADANDQIPQLIVEMFNTSH